jgi:DNA polymerase bacteriophage-type
MTILHLDLETRSAADLPVCGLDNYASDPTTDVHCAAYAFDDEPVALWRNGEPCPPVVASHIKAGGLVYAHNAAFEFALMTKVLAARHAWPMVQLEQMRCTMAMAYAMSLPGSLDKASAALGIEQRKDMAGSRVMMQLAKPKDDGTFWTPEDDQEKFERLWLYCRQDVEVERAIHNRLMELSDYEQKIWQIDQRINNRGVRVDLEAVNAAIRLVESEKARLDGEMLRVTGGEVGKCTEVQLLVKWIRNHGVAINGVAKADVLDALAADGLPPQVAAALNLRREAAKSSTAKLIAMRDAASADGRVRGILQYHGANTGRWAGRRIQVQNFPRGSLAPEDVEDAIAHLGNRRYIDMMYGQPLDVVSSCLRGMITASLGHELVAADFNAIEARVLAWLAGQESVLEIFRTHGKIYEHAAAGIYNMPMESVTKAQRQIGKVAVLALGYGGGIGAFQSMARIYGVKVPDNEADKIKSAWREAHPRIVHYWHDHESAAINAVQLGCVCKAGPAGRQVSYKKDGSFLWCRLPSGRVLCYPYPTVRDVEVPWGGTKPALFYWRVNGVTNKWEETNTYGGDLAQSATQAAARDLLADAIVRLEYHGYPVVMHCHDEVVVEIATDAPQDTTEKVEQLISQIPDWAAGLPVSAEGFRAKRYRK